MAKSNKQARAITLQPSPWDHGIKTQAQRGLMPDPEGGKRLERRTIEEARVFDERKGEFVNPNGVTRARKRSVAEVYQARGYLDARQARAAEILLDAYLATQIRGGKAIMAIRVDTSFGKDEAMVARMTAVARWVEVERMVPDLYAREVLHIGRDDLPITDLPGYVRGRSMDRLRQGLDLLAASLGL